jgi:hypothetical protein
MKRTTNTFKLSQSAKRLIATAAPEKRAAIKNVWVEAEANASFKPKRVTGNRIAGLSSGGDD